MQNAAGRSPLLLVGDHAGRAIPAALGDLGLGAADLERHIAWDIGVAGLGAALARRLDAVFISQRYSRLVIDCNRALGAAGSIAEESDGSPVPGNAALSGAQQAARAREVFDPYHQRITQELDRRQGEGRATILVALHSFCPALAGAAPRPWRYGVLHRGDSAYSRAVLSALRERLGSEVGDNQPYAMDGTDFTVPFHCDPRSLDYLELEVRQDCIATPAGQSRIAGELEAILKA